MHGYRHFLEAGTAARCVGRRGPLLRLAGAAGGPEQAAAPEAGALGDRPERVRAEPCRRRDIVGGRDARVALDPALLRVSHPHDLAVPRRAGGTRAHSDLLLRHHLLARHLWPAVAHLLAADRDAFRALFLPASIHLAPEWVEDAPAGGSAPDRAQVSLPRTARRRRHGRAHSRSSRAVRAIGLNLRRPLLLAAHRKNIHVGHRRAAQLG
mmetsp:Transcript_39203/g.96868  ORF Transcript_39203/g.96868 Transcript_39203/m.96868 type:complete len:210 (+) Transcript_39203:114-743(+)